MQLAQINISPPPIFSGSKIDLTNYSNFLGSFFSRALLFSIAIGGIFFFLKLINSGFIFLTSIGEPGKIQSATKELTNASIGLLLIISVIFLTQIMETVLGIKIFI